VAALSHEERVAPLGGLVDAVTAQFPELQFLAPSGVLRVPVDTRPLTRLRIELPQQFLHLQSIALVTANGSDAASGATVTASSWHGHYAESFDPSRLFDWDNPSGTVVHTDQDDVSWIEVRFRRPVRLTEVRLRNVASNTAVRARMVRVVGHSRWGRSEVLFDGKQLQKKVRAAAKKHDLGDLDPQVRTLVPVTVNTLLGAYPEARKAVKRAELDPDLVKAFRSIVNAELLPSRELLWTIHGPCRAFRYWTTEQQTSYVAFTCEVVEALREITPYVSFGFGAVLAVVRDKALIPHDDDLDIIVAFEPHEAATIAEGLAVVTEALEQRGFSVRGNWSAHRQVGRNGRGKHVDLFVGLFEGDAVSWYPGARGALNRTMMYPTTTAPLLGIDCVIPAHAEDYLAALYGEGWRTPDANFKHRWDRAAYADISGAAAPLGSAH
jgi:hypothetical protein